MTDLTADALAIAEADADELRLTIEHLHTRLSLARVEIEAHIGRCEAADQRARSLDAALTAEREAGKGLMAQVEQWRTVGDRLATIAGELFGPFPVQSPDEDLTAIERGAYDGIRAAQELAAIRDLVAPGNPQGTVVDAVRARIDTDRNRPRPTPTTPASTARRRRASTRSARS